MRFAFHNIVCILFLACCIAQDEPGYCNGCFCITGDNGECPVELEPNMNFTSFMSKLLEFELQNPVTLDCDPFSNETNCDFQPEPLTEGGACVVDFSPPSDEPDTPCPTNHKYTVRTFGGTLEEAQAQGLYVTHAGSCGACSTLQDLYVYMSKGDGLGDEATSCGIRGLTNTQDGIACYRELGFTEGCATVWYWNTINTQRFCLDICLELVAQGTPNNGAAPECALNECINCDELNSGPLFVKYAGRTRRNSGMLSSIARSCAELILLPQTDPCDAVPLPSNSPTRQPDTGSSTRSPLYLRSAAVIQSMTWVLLLGVAIC